MASTDISGVFTSRNRDWAQVIGLAGAYLFSFFAFLGTAPATIGTVLFTLAFVSRLSHWRSLEADRLMQLCLAYTGYLLVHSLIFWLTAPSPTLAQEIARSGRDWIALLQFIPFAYWVAGREDRAQRLLFLALVGFALDILRNIDWATFNAAFFSTRFGANLPANAFGMFTGLGTLGLVAMRDRFWQCPPTRERQWPWVGLWVLFAVVMAEGLVLSLSRGSWLAFAAALVVLLVAEWRGRDKNQRSRVDIVGTTALVALILALLVGLNAGSIKGRVAADSGTIDQITQGRITAPPSGSGGLRLHVWRFGLAKWAERPWFGWGAGSSYYLIEHSGRPDIRDGAFWLDHLHNTYLEILVQLGAIGFGLISLMLLVLVRGVAQECRSGRMSGDLCRLFAASLAFVLVWNLFEYRVVKHDWTFFWILFAGTAYSFRLRTSREGEATDPASGRAS
ncbi:MAG: O-antigen ligase family protein [Chromatiaceae bacterium]